MFSAKFASALRLAVVVGSLAAVSACGGGDGSDFTELLFVSDRDSVTSYAVVGGSANALDTVTVPGIPGTYDRSGTLVTVTMQKHNLQDGLRVRLDFFGGVGGTATDGMYAPTVVDDDTFTVTDTASGTITGGTLLRDPVVSLAATYVQSGTTITVTLLAHELNSSDGVNLDFTSGGGVDDDLEVDTVVDVNSFTLEADVAATTSGNVIVSYGTNYMIFGMAMHPNGRWLYVTSQYECSNGRPYCWGGDLISRFAIDWGDGSLRFEESVRTSDEVGSVTEPSPVKLEFSADGTRLVHQDDDLDGLRLWSVDPTDGSLGLLANSGANTTGQHGIAISADGTRVYHGSQVFTVGPASITAIVGGNSGEANRIVSGTMFAILGGGNNAQVRAFSLADPDLPLQLATTANTPNRARDLAIAQNGALIVTSGFGGLKSYTYDGASIVPAVGAGSTELPDGGGPFPAPDTLARVYRSVSLNAAETLCVAAYFTNDPDASIGGVQPSGFVLVNVAADGSLSLANDVSLSTYAREARFFQKP